MVMDEDTIKEMVEFFFKNKIPAHVEDLNGTWYNGLITEIKSNFFVIDDKVKGVSPVAFTNIRKIERYKER